jgi:hypothetical protein
MNEPGIKPIAITHLIYNIIFQESQVDFLFYHFMQPKERQGMPAGIGKR